MEGGWNRYNGSLLSLLTLAYVFGEFAHYLIGVVRIFKYFLSISMIQNDIWHNIIVSILIQNIIVLIADQRYVTRYRLWRLFVLLK